VAPSEKLRFLIAARCGEDGHWSFEGRETGCSAKMGTVVRGQGTHTGPTRYVERAHSAKGGRRAPRGSPGEGGGGGGQVVKAAAGG
jgi:hypothetical protein